MMEFLGLQSESMPLLLDRRSFVRSMAALSAAARAVGAGTNAPPNAASDGVLRRTEGLLIGTLIGDALGGPIEFQDPIKVQQLDRPPKAWKDHEILDLAALDETEKRLLLRSYRDLRPVPEPYAHWTTNAEPGTITDDSRHKLVLIEMFRTAKKAGRRKVSAADLARAYLAWPLRESIRNREGYAKLNEDWLREWWQASRWVLGDRKVPEALPPSRLWTGLSTCCGQMTLLPLAALFPGEPERAYRAAYQLAFFDNGPGLDLNAALLAGLSVALAGGTVAENRKAPWDAIFSAMRQTDPYRYRQVPWTPRAVDRWLDFSLKAVEKSDGHPARLFASLEKEFQQTIKWEAQVPFAVTFAVLAMAQYRPLAALQLSIEWGHDTDSYAQLVGALVGALHGPEIFPKSLRETVENRLWLDYEEKISDWVRLLAEARDRGMEIAD